MTVLVKKVFTSSNPAIVRFLCPPPCGPFSIQESAVGGLSYKAKNYPAKIPGSFYSLQCYFYITLRNNSFSSSTLVSFGLPGLQASA